MILVEVCADSPAGVAAALSGGADRIELCTALALGGLTPSHGLIKEAWRMIDAHNAAAADDDAAPAPPPNPPRAAVQLVVLIRPRAGDFVYDEREARVMEEDIAACARLGADSVAVGALEPVGGEGFDVDASLLARLTKAARAAGLPQPCCFHRAFDLVRDRARALEQLAADGFVGRVLTSGGCARAADESGRAALADLVRQAPKGLEIVAAGGIRPDNVAAVVKGAGVRQVHSSAGTGLPFERLWRRERQQQPGHDRHQGAVLGSVGATQAQDEWHCADEETVRAIVREARAAGAGAASAAEVDD